MRYIAKAYAKDTRPEKPEGFDSMSADDKKKARKKAPNGFRTKSGVTKLGEEAVFEVKTFGEAVSETAKLLNDLDPKAQAQVERVEISTDASDPATGANPFAR